MRNCDKNTIITIIFKVSIFFLLFLTFFLNEKKYCFSISPIFNLHSFTFSAHAKVYKCPPILCLSFVNWVPQKWRPWLWTFVFKVIERWKFVHDNYPPPPPSSHSQDCDIAYHSNALSFHDFAYH